MNSRLPHQSQYLRASVLTVLSLFLTVIALFFAVYHIALHQEYPLASVEFSLSFYSGYIYTLVKKDQYTQTSVTYYAYYLVAIIGFGTYMQPLSSGLYLWTSFVPLMLYLLLGLKHGQYATGFVLLAQCINILMKLNEDTSGEVAHTLINLGLCYVGIWAVSHVYESNRANIEGSLFYLASRDTLTGTHNRLSLNDTFNKFESKQLNANALCLLIIDIDYFKCINDKFGHDTGDKVLIDSTGLMTRIVGDDNLFRIGGEEFCVTLFDKDIKQAQEIGEHLCAVFNHHVFSFGDKRIQLTLSIGICQYHCGDKLADLLKLADVELYKAKNNGRNQVCMCTTVTTHPPTKIVNA
jgi:diguanylate cyclase (GGDEF)-like protein